MTFSFRRKKSSKNYWIPTQCVNTRGSGLVKELPFKKRECNLHMDDFAIGQQVASFAFQCSLILFFIPPDAKIRRGWFESIGRCHFLAVQP